MQYLGIRQKKKKKKKKKIASNSSNIVFSKFNIQQRTSFTK